MRHANYCVYDEFIPASVATSSNPTYTSTKLEKRLAHYDTLVIQVVLDNFATSPATDTFNLRIEHSADGRTFSPWNTSPPDISATVPAGTPTVIVASAPTTSQTQPLLGRVRLAMWFNSSMAAHVKVHVTQRDTGG